MNGRLLYKFRKEQDRSIKSESATQIKVSPFEDHKWVGNLITSAMTLVLTEDKSDRKVEPCSRAPKDFIAEDCDVLATSLQVNLRNSWFASTGYSVWMEQYPELAKVSEEVEWFEPIFMTLAGLMKTELRLGKTWIVLCVFSLFVFFAFFYESFFFSFLLFLFSFFLIFFFFF